MTTPQTRWNAKDRERKRALGLVRRDVWAHPDDWPLVRDLEKMLQKNRAATLEHTPVDIISDTDAEETDR